MTSWNDWQQRDAEFAKDYAARMDDLMPEPLFESFDLPTAKVCLRCGQRQAVSILCSSTTMQPVLPLCATCAAEWNFGGYQILKGMDPKKLLWRLMMYKVKRPFRGPSILETKTDVRNLMRRVRKMKRLKDESQLAIRGMDKGGASKVE